MTRGRKPNLPAADLVEVQLDHQALAKAGDAANVLSARSLEVSERYGDGSAYDRHRVVSEARFFMSQSAEAMLEFGKRLVQIKENEPHGEFIEIVEGSLGINQRAAQKMMQAAVKFLSPRLKANAPLVAHLGKSKLLVLMSESEDDLEELTAGGTLAGATLDDMQAMTRDELRSALREARQTAEAKDRIISNKSAQLDKIAEEEERRRTAPLPEQEGFQIDALRSETLQAEVSLLRLLKAVDDITAAPATEAAGICARQSLDYLVQRLTDACLERGITVDLAERVSPIWSQQIDAMVDAAPPSRRGKKH